MRDVVDLWELREGRDADCAAEELLELAVDWAARADLAVCGGASKVSARSCDGGGTCE